MNDGQANEFESRTWLFMPIFMLPAVIEPGFFSAPLGVALVPLVIALTASGYLFSTPRLNDSTRRRILLRIDVAVVVVVVSAVIADLEMGHRFDAIWVGCLGAVMAWTVYPSGGTLRRWEKERTRPYSPFAFWTFLICMAIELGLLVHQALSGFGHDPTPVIMLGSVAPVVLWDERRRKRAHL